MSPERQAEETPDAIDTGHPDGPSRLSARERLVIEKAQGGATYREIADELGVTAKTIQRTVANAMTKLAAAPGRRKPEPLESTPLSQLLRARREALGFSRPEVARRTGITESALDTYERGVKPRVDTAMLLARFYGISYADLAEAVGVPPTPEGAHATPAQAITKERMERGWTVEQMARELGATPHEVAAWERGDLEVTAAILARVMTLPAKP